MYSGPIVDAHHHIWRQRDLPWLSGEMVPRIFGPYEPIRRDYPAEEYIAEARGCGITQSVYVQANWPLDRSLDEVRWVQEVHEATGWPSAVIGSADLFDDDAPETMREQAAPLRSSAGRGCSCTGTSARSTASRPGRPGCGSLSSAGTSPSLQDLGWVFELQVFPGQMADAAELVSAFPDTTFVLVHAGMLVGTERRHRPGVGGAACASWRSWTTSSSS